MASPSYAHGESEVVGVLSQLTLQELSFPEERTLESFVSLGNEVTVGRLKSLVSAPNEARLVWLAGAHGNGKTHLAEGLCRTSGVWPRGYFVFEDSSDTSRESDFSLLRFLVVDDVQLLLGDAKREQWLVQLMDVRRRSGLPTLFVAEDGPGLCQCALKDVRTRLSMAEILWLEPLADEIKLGVMVEFARVKGFKLSEDVLGYVLRRHNRNLGRLIELVRQIDQYSLRAKRPVTVPLVRDLFKGGVLGAG